MDQSDRGLPHPLLPTPTSDDRLLWDLHTSEQYVLWLAAEDELGLFAELETSGASAEHMASKLGIGLKGAEGLLGVMAALGFLVHYRGEFGLTELARTFLLPSSPYYRGPWLQAVRSRPRLTYASIRDAIRRDVPIPLLEEGVGYWEKRGSDEDAGRAYAESMHALSFASASGLATRGDFSRVQRLLDIGGGSGGMSIGLVLHYPTLRCTVMDRQPACAYAHECIVRFNVQDRVDTVIGDAFMDTWPGGYDAILLSNFFNSLDTVRSMRLIEMCFAYLPSGGHLYIHEMLLRDTGDGPLGVVASSLYGYLLGHSNQFSAGELTDMLLRGGFSNISVVPTYGYSALLTASK